MKYSRKCLVCNKEVISSNKRTFVHLECKDRPTPAVETKTAEEILDDNTTGVYVHTINNERVPYYNHNEVIKTILAYHAQFTPSAKSVEVEEAAKPTNYLYEKYKHMPLTTKEIRMQARIDELEKAYKLKDIRITGLESALWWIANNSNEETIRVFATKALKTNKDTQNS